MDPYAEGTEPWSAKKIELTSEDTTPLESPQTRLYYALTSKADDSYLRSCIGTNVFKAPQVRDSVVRFAKGTCVELEGALSHWRRQLSNPKARNPKRVDVLRLGTKATYLRQLCKQEGKSAYNETASPSDESEPARKRRKTFVVKSEQDIVAQTPPPALPHLLRERVRDLGGIDVETERKSVMRAEREREIQFEMDHQRILEREKERKREEQAGLKGKGKGGDRKKRKRELQYQTPSEESDFDDAHEKLSQRSTHMSLRPPTSRIPQIKVELKKRNGSMSPRGASGRSGSRSPLPPSGSPSPQYKHQYSPKVGSPLGAGETAIKAEAPMPIVKLTIKSPAPPTEETAKRKRDSVEADAGVKKVKRESGSIPSPARSGGGTPSSRNVSSPAGSTSGGKRPGAKPTPPGSSSGSPSNPGRLLTEQDVINVLRAKGVAMAVKDIIGELKVPYFVGPFVDQNKGNFRAFMKRVGHQDENTERVTLKPEYMDVKMEDVKRTFGHLKSGAQGQAIPLPDESNNSIMSDDETRPVRPCRRGNSSSNVTASPKPRSLSAVVDTDLPVNHALQREIETLRQRLRESEQNRKRMRDMPKTAVIEDSEMDRAYRRACSPGEPAKRLKFEFCETSVGTKERTPTCDPRLHVDEEEDDDEGHEDGAQTTRGRRVPNRALVRTDSVHEGQHPDPSHVPKQPKARRPLTLMRRFGCKTIVIRGKDRRWEGIKVQMKKMRYAQWKFALDARDDEAECLRDYVQYLCDELRERENQLAIAARTAAKQAMKSEDAEERENQLSHALLPRTLSFAAVPLSSQNVLNAPTSTQLTAVPPPAQPTSPPHSPVFKIPDWPAHRGPKPGFTTPPSGPKPRVISPSTARGNRKRSSVSTDSNFVLSPRSGAALRAWHEKVPLGGKKNVSFCQLF
ncbi:hypothetical protein HDV00_000962 [Rhizophlyctis rosea]|nr:hypothetical protein HDV00_000962 [Rhizophlyctis rosea]